MIEQLPMPLQAAAFFGLILVVLFYQDVILFLVFGTLSCIYEVCLALFARKRVKRRGRRP